MPVLGGASSASAAAGTSVTLSRGEPGDDTYSRAVRLSDTPIFSAAQGSFASIYYPFVLRVDDLLGSPLGAYYMWYSSDHDTGGPGGIGLATAPTRLGPWTNRGVVYVDTVVGNQTETPSVIYNPDDPTTPFWMYYQQNGLDYNQSTALAKSADGVTWTRHGKVLDYPHYTALPYTEMPGQGHTGYFKPFRIGSLWVGYHLFGGSLSHFAVSYSLDGLVWQTDPRLLYLNSDLTGDPAAQFTLLDAVRSRGQVWGFGVQGVAGDYGVSVAPVSANLRSYLGKPRSLIRSTLPWEGTYIRSHTLLVDEGRTFLYYTTTDGTATGGNVGIAEVL